MDNYLDLDQLLKDTIEVIETDHPDIFNEFRCTLHGNYCGDFYEIAHDCDNCINLLIKVIPLQSQSQQPLCINISNGPKGECFRVISTLLPMLRNLSNFTLSLGAKGIEIDINTVEHWVLEKKSNDIVFRFRNVSTDIYCNLINVYFPTNKAIPYIK